MGLDKAIQGMFEAENRLRSRRGILDPGYMSEQMMRISQYAGAVEEHLAALEEEYEQEMSRLLKRYMLGEGRTATASEHLARIELGPTKGRIAYLGRLVSSAWKQVGICQSRINHLEKGIAGQT